MTRPLLAVLFLLTLIVSATAQRQAYYLNTNWVPQVKQEGTNTVTNMVGMITAEAVPPPVVATAAPVVPAEKTDSDLGFIITTLTTIIASILALLAKWKGMQQKKLNTTLGQNIETYSEVTKAQPGGVALDAKIKDEIQSQQVDAGVKKMAKEVREEQVNTSDAKESAERVMRPAPVQMKASLLSLFLLTGCTTFHVTQIDESPGDRIITTEIKGAAWFSGAQSLTKIKALTTDKTQSFNAGHIGQQGPTNFIEALNALARIAEAVRPTP